MCLRLVIVLLMSTGASLVAAQELVPSSGGASPLGIRQRKVERMMDDLEQKFKSLKLTLQENEPQQADRLQLALNRAKELLIQKRMGDITRLLDESQLEAADDGQKALLADIRTLLALLLEERSTGDQALGESERLSHWKERIETLIQAESSQRRDTNRGAAHSQEAFEKLAQSQDDIANQTLDLQRQMQSASQPNADGHGERPLPGQPEITQAHQSMQQASATLRKHEPASASQQQSSAIDALQAALRQIDDRLNELRSRVQAEMLAHLEERFRQMLTDQQRLTAQTAALHQKRITAGGQLNRGDRNSIRVIGDEERRLEAVKSETEAKDAGLAGQAQQAVDTLIEDGTSIVLRDIVEQLRDDLVVVGNLLADELRTDEHTASRQAEIETTLEELIEALQQVRQQQSGDAATASAAEGNAEKRKKPLMSDSAELKLLRAAQLRINRQTAALDDARSKSGPPSDALTAAIRRVAERQAAVAEITARILKRGP